VAVVVFYYYLKLAQPGLIRSKQYFIIIWARSSIGWLLLGLAVGYLGYKLIASIDHYQVEVLIT
jgi:CPA1 family monovalent cation:H+ antiporter